MTSVLTRCLAIALGMSTATVCVAGLAVDAQAPTGLISVEVEVLDRDGAPVEALGPDRFDVSIDGRRRQVLSAIFVRPPPPAAGGVPTDAGGPVAPRTFVLTLDLVSVPPAATASLVETARAFMQQVPARDLVGLATLPGGPRIDPIEDRSAVATVLDGLVGQGDGSAWASNRYQLTPSNIIDLAVARAREPQVDPQQPEPNTDLARAVDGICPHTRDPFQCRLDVVYEAQSLAFVEEGRAVDRLTALRALVSGLGTRQERRRVVLVTGGLFESDVAGARPNLATLRSVIGQETARTNTSIDVLLVDQQALDLAGPEGPRRPRPTDNRPRDAALLSGALERIADQSGGRLMTVGLNEPEDAIASLLDVQTGHYVLGLRPDASDRVERPRPLEVEVDTGQRGAVVHARSWVVVTAADNQVAAAEPTAPEGTRFIEAEPSTEDVAAWEGLWSGELLVSESSDESRAPVYEAAPSTAPEEAAAGSPREPTLLDDLYAAYEVGDYSAIADELQTPADFERYRPVMAATLEAWRQEWSPRRAAFAFEVAVTAFARGWPQPGRYLADARAIVTARPDPPGARPEEDAFELLFHRAAVALLAAVGAPRDIEAYLEAISQRVVLGTETAGSGVLVDARLLLARAMALEAGTLPAALAAGSRSNRLRTWVAPADDDYARRRLSEVLVQLDAAALDPETHAEASVRRAFVLHRLGAHEDARAVLEALPEPADATVGYWRSLILGRVQAALGRPQDALAELERAASLVPGAQTAAVAMAAMTMALGDRETAMAWAETARSSTDPNRDPWPRYWTGDSRFLPQWIGELRRARP